MIKNIYTICDNLSDLHCDPFVINPRLTERTFNQIVERSDKFSCRDRVIKFIGTFDDETGIITPCNPEVVFNMEEAKEDGKQS